MKRIAILLIIAFAITAVAAAQTYTVTEVTGRVERNAGGGKWAVVNVGDTLRADAEIKTIIGSNLTVKSGDEVLSVGPMKTGKLSEVASAGTVQIQGRVSQTDTGAASRSSSRLSTASARATDASELMD